MWTFLLHGDWSKISKFSCNKKINNCFKRRKFSFLSKKTNSYKSYLTFGVWKVFLMIIPSFFWQRAHFSPGYQNKKQHILMLARWRKHNDLVIKALVVCDIKRRILTPRQFCSYPCNNVNRNYNAPSMYRIDIIFLYVWLLFLLFLFVALRCLLLVFQLSTLVKFRGAIIIYRGFN